MNLKNTEKSAKEVSGKMTRSGMTLGNIWFVTDEHCNNFIQLLKKFNAAEKPEYAAACYVVAHPEIYYRINWTETKNPIGWYWGEWNREDENDDEGYHAESEIVGQLSSAYRGLVQAVVEMYTGRKQNFDLMGWLGNAGDEVYKLFIQAMEIRRDRFVIEIAE
ncbi:DUF2538 family protein [Bacillus sp. FJAT-28004]|uniref:DUF2538 family protein n=1 Tax=Bacillus sp. FJAT-28004 TaxID=1679165 RepID=UPI0006B62826|nr:DUF2538 family protein [Bacillus sp. FJAT-28004]